MKVMHLFTIRSARALGLAGLFLALSPSYGQEAWFGPIPTQFDSDSFVFQLAGAGTSFLGVGVAEVDSERAQKLNLKEERGVEITRVEPDSPAEKAGLKVGDAVLEYQGQRVEGTEQFVRLVRETPPGRAAKLTISRNGQVQTIPVTIGTRKAMMLRFPDDGFNSPRFREMPEIPMIPDVPKPNITWRSGRLGIDAESLNSQLAEFFGVKEGVLVRSVMKDSPAEKAGIKAGDVITRVGDSRVTNPREITSVMRSQGDKNVVPVTIVRDKREMTVTVTVDNDRSDSERPRGRSVSERWKM